MRKLACLLTLLLLGLAPAARGQELLDVRAWLMMPGTKVLAGEFYSVYCKPCMKAVPRWKRLYEKYRSKGLRFVVGRGVPRSPAGSRGTSRTAASRRLVAGAEAPLAPHLGVQ